MAFIYLITNDINGKQYVGKTNRSIDERFQEHLRSSKRKCCEKRPLYSAIRKYGIEHFHIEELEKCPAELSIERESYWIERLKTYGSNGYNATKGGDGKKYYDYEEIAHKYQELGNEHKTALFFGCCDDTVRMACRQHNISIVSDYTQYRKAVAKIDKDTNQMISIYPSIKEASLDNSNTDRNNSSIARACSGERQTALGYKWSFI